MDETTRRALISGKLDRGELPRRPPSSVQAGYSAGEVCDGCAQPITEGDVVYVVDFRSDPGGLTLRLHQRCSQLWDSERRGDDVAVGSVASFPRPLSATRQTAGAAPRPRG